MTILVCKQEAMNVVRTDFLINKPKKYILPAGLR